MGLRIYTIPRQSQLHCDSHYLQYDDATCSDLFQLPEPAQLHSHGSGSGCSAGGRLVLSSADLRDIFVASTAELPGLLLAAAVMDGLGRKW